MTATATVANPAADALPIQPAATPAFRVVRTALRPLLHSVLRVRVVGAENLPAGNAVFIANHMQWVDAICILGALPAEPRLHTIGDIVGALERRPALWRLLRSVGGIIPVDRQRHGDQVLFRHVDTCLSRGASLLLFPEGRCSEAEGNVLPFKKGFAHFALAAGVPVVPMGLTGTRSLWLGKRVTLVIGAPIATAGLTVDELTARGQAEVTALPVPYRERRGPKPLRRWLTGLF